MFEAALNNQPLTVFGDGSQVRSFTHVRDTVSSLLAVAMSSCSGCIFNSGNPANIISINELASLIRQKCESDAEVVHVDPTKIYGPLYAESFDKIPDITKLRTQLGWEPRYGLEDVLDDTLAYYRSRSLISGP
jgi:UDP-glucose 4-epimerase